MTRRSLFPEASNSASASKPTTETTCTVAGWAGPATVSARPAASSAAWRSLTRPEGSFGPAEGAGHPVSGRGWTMR